MSNFLVEDGTGTEALANAYASVTEFKDYHKDRGTDVSTILSSEIEKLLVKATDYIDQRWGTVLKGFRLELDQPLMFPRSYLYTREGALIVGLPAKLVYATCEYALIANTGNLWLTPTVDASGAQIIEKTAGPLTIKYADSGSSGAPSAAVTKAWPAADKYMTEFVLTPGRSSRA